MPHTCKSMWRGDNVGGLGEHAKKCCSFVGIPFNFFLIFALFFGSRRARKSGRILMIYTSYDV